MIAPEVWYEYQRSYQKYGFDMKPKEKENIPEAPKRTRTRRQAIETSRNSRKVAFYMVVAVATAMILLIIITAYAANVRYEVNSLIKENRVIAGEIENLNAKVCSNNSIDCIEGKAIAQMGMVYPEDGGRVHITSDDMPSEGFADIIREKAYN